MEGEGRERESKTNKLFVIGMKKKKKWKTLKAQHLNCRKNLCSYKVSMGKRNVNKELNTEKNVKTKVRRILKYQKL